MAMPTTTRTPTLHHHTNSNHNNTNRHLYTYHHKNTLYQEAMTRTQTRPRTIPQCQGATLSLWWHYMLKVLSHPPPRLTQLMLCPFCHCDISLDFEQSLLLPCVTSWMCLGETSAPHSAPHSVYGKPMMFLGQTSVPHSAPHSVYGKPILFLGQASVSHHTLYTERL